MLEQLLTIAYLLAHDVQLPFNLNEPLQHTTEQWQPTVGALSVLDEHTFVTPRPTEPPLIRSGSHTLAVKAKRAMLVDAESGTVLLAKNQHEQTQPASIVKLLTAQVAINRLTSLDQVFTVPKEIRELDPASSVAGFVVGEKVTARDLLAALLISSANDAAVTLAHGLSGSQKTFVTEMNDYADLIGLSHTKVANVTGLDHTGNSSTARDIAFLLLHAQRQPLISDFTTRGATTITTVDGNAYYLKPTDQLLTVTNHDIRAGKTGTTDEAGQSFVVMAESQGRSLIAVVLDSPDRFTEAESMLAYGFSSFVWATRGDTQFANDAEAHTPYGG